jgi:hypothetical protein
MVSISTVWKLLTDCQSEVEVHERLSY